MNNNIDFSDFHKISVDRPSKCRKFTKHKFTIITFLMIILLIIVIIVYSNKKKQQSKKEKELAQKKNDTMGLDSNLADIFDLVNKSRYNYSALEFNYNETKEYKKGNQSEFDILKIVNGELYSTFNKLKEDYNKVNTKLNYVNQIREKNDTKNLIIQRLSNKVIEYSNVVNDVKFFENKASVEVKNKCYDSIVYGFNPQRFEENCLGTPLLFLIKTQNEDNIGVYTSKSFQGKLIAGDEDSLLINFDTSQIFNYNSESSDECSIHFNDEKFLKFGKDLTINMDGSGNSEFPTCYGINEGEQIDFVEDEFIIKILEIYKVNKN